MPQHRLVQKQKFQYSHLNIGAPLSKISGKAVEKLTDNSWLNFFTDDPGEDQHHNHDADHEYDGDDDDGNDDDNDDDVDDDEDDDDDDIDLGARTCSIAAAVGSGGPYWPASPHLMMMMIAMMIMMMVVW